jgi:DNA-binding MarR family transcriptional regulator
LADAEHMTGHQAKPATPDASGIAYGALDERAGYWLRRAQIAVFQDFFRVFRPFDIRPAQYSTLTIIERNPGLTQTQVADALGIKKANFVPMIKTLEARGLARRQPVEGDRRSYGLFLTADGIEMIGRMHQASAAHEDKIRAALGDERYAALSESLRALTAAMGRADIDNDDNGYSL